MHTRSIGRSIVIGTAVAMLFAVLSPAATASPRPGAAAHRDAGDVWVQIRSGAVHVPGSPYGWRFTFTRFEPQGMPAGNWDLTVEANRAVNAGGHKVHQLHDWAFDVFSGAVTVPGDIRGVVIDADLDDGFGSADLGFKDLSPLAVEPIECHATGKVIARESSRRGTFTGTFDFDPQIVDPQVPVSVDLHGVKGRVSRERDTGRGCPDNDTTRCTNQKIAIAFEDLDAETQVGVNLQQFPRYAYGQVFQTVDDGVVRISHSIWALGDFPDPVSSDAVSVTAEFGSLAPFVENDAMSWTKAVPDVHDGPKCRRAHYNLIGDLGAIDVDFDSGPITIDVPAEGSFYAETKHQPV